MQPAFILDYYARHVRSNIVLRNKSTRISIIKCMILCRWDHTSTQNDVLIPSFCVDGMMGLSSIIPSVISKMIIFSSSHSVSSCANLHSFMHIILILVFALLYQNTRSLPWPFGNRNVLQVGSRQMSTGEVCAVKVLGVLAMIDDGETDWKVIAIRTDDRLATHMSDVADLEREMPGAVHAIREWLRVYKVPEGKPENEFAMEERALPRDFAMHVIEETHGLWKGKYGSHAQI